MKETFKSLIEDRKKNLRRLKGQGKKIIGYLCSYCPEEIVYAAGLVPVRILGGEGTYTFSSRHLQPFYCSYSHGCLNEALRGKVDYLDGLVYAYSCEHTRGAYDSWRVNIPTRYTKFLDMPGWVSTSEAVKFYLEELKGFKKSLEEAFSLTITQEDLIRAVEVCNRNRALLRQIYQLKQSATPVLSGTEAFSFILSSMVCPKEEHNKLLSRALAGLKRRKRGIVPEKRLMVLGTDLHEPGIFEAIENQGAIVVADELCTGARYIWEDVKLEGDPLEAIARRYLQGINCPVKHPVEGRLSFIERMIPEFSVERVLFLHNRNCDPQEWAEPAIKRLLKERNIPWVSVEIAGVSTADDIARVTEAAREF